MPKNKIVVCCKFWNDLPNIIRLVESINGRLPCIFVDGRWLNYGRGEPLSTDGSREYLKKQNIILLDAPDLIEYQSRNVYCQNAQELGYEYCLVIDSDEFIVDLDVDLLEKEIGKEDSYSYVQEYDSTSHNIFYRFHKSEARHRERHQDIFINDKHIFNPNSTILKGIRTRYDKKLRNIEEEKYRKQYYARFPIR